MEKFMKKLLYFVLFAGLTIGFTAQTADLELKVKTYSNKMFQYFKQMSSIKLVRSWKMLGKMELIL
jgi:secreted Zn-dependent insulinase-like peptidase